MPNTTDDGSLGEMLAHVAERPSQQPYRAYLTQMLDLTAEGLLGHLTSEQLALDYEAAYAVLLDTGVPNAVGARSAILRVLSHPIPSADELQADIDTILLNL